MKLIQTEETLSKAAAKAGMDEKTARKYLKSGKLPSEIKAPHTWRTRPDPFEEVWEEVRVKVEINPGLEAKTLFEDLQRRYPGRFSDGQLRTFQRRVKVWRALEGPGKEVFFPQKHHPGRVCQSDFTHMDKLGVTINKQPFNHLIFHFVLPYSNWETGRVCFSESFESLCDGFQDALWELGGVPFISQTDRLSTAVNKTDNPEEFTRRYQALLNHYGIEGRKIQAASPNENGDVEQRHHRFKRAVDQALMLRGSRDFESRSEYEGFLKKLFSQLNSGRRDRFLEEQEVLRRLPLQKFDSCRRLKLKVGKSSTIRAAKNVYSVHSRLIGERIEVRLFAEYLEIWHAQHLIETIPRQRGESKHRINYRHVIDTLVRKPGAFENYRYRDDLFPGHRFRLAFDALKKSRPARAHKEYLKILYLAARENESAVDEALGYLIDHGRTITAHHVELIVNSKLKPARPAEVRVSPVDLAAYDALLDSGGATC